MFLPATMMNRFPSFDGPAQIAGPGVHFTGSGRKVVSESSDLPQYPIPPLGLLIHISPSINFRIFTLFDDSHIHISIGTANPTLPIHQYRFPQLTNTQFSAGSHHVLR
ncbi:hypothetical protein ACP275_08G223500 [Erythranthe tilingii]